jgi:hypothetical protein
MGFIETPYRKVTKGQVDLISEPVYLSAEEEEGKMTVYMDLTKNIDFQLNRLTFTRPLLTNEQEMEEEPLKTEETLKTEEPNKSSRKFEPFEIGPSPNKKKSRIGFNTSYGGKIKRRKTKKNHKLKHQTKKRPKSRPKSRLQSRRYKNKHL